LANSKVPNLRHQFAIRILTENLRDTYINDIVDIGCANFELLNLLKSQNFNTLGNFVGIEPSYQEAIPESVIFINDFFSSNVYTFDSYNHPNLVILDNVLEHIDDCVAFLNEINLWLKNGDYIYICVPSLEVMIKKSRFEEITHEHEHYFSLSVLRRLLISRGFKEVVSHTQEIYNRAYNFHLFQKGDEISQSRLPSSELEYPLIYQFKSRFDSFVSTLSSTDITFENTWGVCASELTPVVSYFMNSDLSFCAGILDSTPVKHGKYMPGIRPQIFPWEHVKKLPHNYSFFVTVGSLEIIVANKLRAIGFSKVFAPNKVSI
jgi:methylation protein EvaC